MKSRIVAALAAVLLSTMGLFAVSASPAHASVGAYTWVQRISGAGGTMQVRCHVPAGAWRTLLSGENSNQKCGASGWVEAILVVNKSLFCINLNTGNETNYGWNYRGSIGGGSYYCYTSDFNGGGGGGGGGGGKHAVHKDTQWGG